MRQFPARQASRLVLTVALIGSSLSSAAACGTGSKPSASGQSVNSETSTGTQPVQTESSTQPSNSARSQLTAAQVIKKLGDTVQLTVTYTEESDTNHLLGRPGQYTSKAAFVDTRIDRSSVADNSPGSVELGGGVEVFDSAQEAKVRAEYIVSVTQGVAILAEYDYLAGTTLLRLSNLLTPRQVKPLVAALEEATGSSASLIK